MSEDKNLRDAGLKVTLPRVRILEIFDKSPERHLSADDVYKKILDSVTKLVWQPFTEC